jgi:membrane-bound metal-dependent hydrolase YbcI (DUF457 family)
MEQTPPLEANSSIVQLVKYLALFGTRGFTAALTTGHYLHLSCATRIQSKPSQPISLRTILILSSHLRVGRQNSIKHQQFKKKLSNNRSINNVPYSFVATEIKYY